MKSFMDEDFLLQDEVAQRLYHRFAEEMPIIDYHCHVSPREIYEDKPFENITQLWLYGDHYKWRLMRAAGVEERYITGDAPDYDKFEKFAATLPKCIGNPVYHWCYLELKRYFGYEAILNEKSARHAWEEINKKIKSESMSPRKLIEQSRVEFIGTTDDPIDSLEWHEKLRADESFSAVVAPTFRPDKALNADKAGYSEYIAELSRTSGITVTDTASLKAALSARMEHFLLHGCRASDHGLDYAVYAPASVSECDSVIKRALAGEQVSREDADKLRTEMLVYCAGEYERLGWVMQIHYNCLRNPNTVAHREIGVDKGFDCIATYSPIPLAALLDELYKTGRLPKTIIYSLNPADNAFIDTLVGSFQQSGVQGKVQHGSAWWFNDNKEGMRAQLTSLANLSALGGFVGMLTDSRSFLSYTRHEYFRRVLCGLVGEWVEKGEYPDDMDSLGTIISDISYNNAKRYFGLEKSK